jgi:asparagine synthase (glutamine-hydrolysing)
VRVYDEPFADSSSLPTLLVSQLARRDVTVVLSGDGGDELFGGYTRYAELERQLGVKPAVLRDALGAVARTLPNSTFGRNRLLDLSRTRRGRYTAQMATPLSPREGGVASHELAAQGGPFEDLLNGLFEEAAGRDFPTQMMLVDLMSYLPGDILTKVDRASMSTSLEARVPLLDHVLAEFAVSVPSHLKMRNGTGKWLLRRAAAAVVPSFVFQKPKKGFSLPLGAWFRKDLRHRLDALLRAGSPIYHYVDRNAVRRLVMEHRIGRRDHSSMLWRLIVLDLWIGLLEAGELAQPAYVSNDLAEALV